MTDLLKVQTRPFGRSGASISEIGFGCGGYWGLPTFSEGRAGRILDLAIEGGVTYFDTGPNYSNGNAERRAGRLLGARAEGVFLSTKVGSRLSRFGRTVKDFTPGGMRASLERSLRDLGRDRVDLLQLHSPSPDVLENESTMRAFLSFKEEGLASFLGSSGSPKLARRAAELGVFDSFMITYNVTCHAERRPVMARLREKGMAVLVMAPLAQAVYAPSFFRITSLARFWYLLRALKQSRSDVARANKLAELLRVEGWSAVQVALRFVLENPDVTSAVIGTTNPEHLAELLAVSGPRPLPPEVLTRLQDADA